MRFTIHHDEYPQIPVATLNDNQNGTYASVLPAKGALLHGFGMADQKQFINIIDHYINLEALERELATSFKGSKLSPFPCRIPSGKYVFDGIAYELQHKFIDGSAIHGLLYDKSFEITNKSETDHYASLTMQYEYNQEDEGYPFQYRCEVEYTLYADHRLQVQTRLHNLSDETIPIADGWHPYFQLGGVADEWLLQFNAEGMLEFDANLIPTGRLEEYQFFNELKTVGQYGTGQLFPAKNRT